MRGLPQVRGDGEESEGDSTGEAGVIPAGVPVDMSDPASMTASDLHRLGLDLHGLDSETASSESSDEEGADTWRAHAPPQNSASAFSCIPCVWTYRGRSLEKDWRFSV